MKKSSYNFSIGFYSWLLGAGINQGYGYTAVQLIEAWNRFGVPVWTWDDEAPVAFSFVQPHGYEYQRDRVNIGYTPWESTIIPDGWRYYMNKMTEVWTTSQACKEWYENNGIQRSIRVLPHGINSKHYPIQYRGELSEHTTKLESDANTNSTDATINSRLEESNKYINRTYEYVNGTGKASLYDSTRDSYDSEQRSGRKAISANVEQFQPGQLHNKSNSDSSERTRYSRINKELHQKDKPFRFLHIGADAKRKGAQFVVEAFKKAFDNDPRYELVFKGKPWWDAEEISNIRIIADKYTQAQMSELYLSADCMFYPTQGEGFGLIPFQSAATGCPTFVTEWGGSLDYLQYCWPIKVKDIIECDYEPHVGTWALPDVDHMVDQMHDVVDNYELYADFAYFYAKNLHKNCGWDSIAQQSLNWMKELVDLV